MLMLLFYAGDERYAIEVSQVVEVLPLVELKKLQYAPEYLAGLFKYRGLIVPVIDLTYLLHNQPSHSYLSTRIILIRYQEQEHSTRLFGLMAERVTETINQEATEFVDTGITIQEAPYLGEVVSDEQGLIQRIRVEFLLPTLNQGYLLANSGPQNFLRSDEVFRDEAVETYRHYPE